MGWLSSSLFYEELIAMFWMKMSQIDTENDKNPKIFQISKILFPNFRQTWSIGTLKRVNKERMCSPVGFSEEFIAVFGVKMFTMG